MGELQINKRKRFYAFEPNAILRADFSQKYIHYLLPALIKIGNDRTCDKDENQEIEKIVRFEVDMALVFSASGFAWSHALKRKLKRDFDPESPLKTPTNLPTSSSLLQMYGQNKSSNIEEKVGEISLLPPLSRHLVPVGYQKNNSSKDSEKSQWDHPRSTRKRTRITGDSEETESRLRTLRKLLPGGDEMNMCELLSQVESYVACLEVQVSILRTLVNIH
ncbi:hypothetical protein AAC387_Pa05g2408 [Persea americana]